jgi:hypothetical protein
MYVSCDALINMAPVTSPSAADSTRRVALSLLVLLAPLSFSASVHGATITVNGGGQGAIANAISNAGLGDVISVGPGNYDDNADSALRISKSGTASSPITLKSCQKHAAKIGNLEFSNASHFIVDGFEITPQTPYQTEYHTIMIRGGQGVTLRNMLIHHVRQGVSVDTGTNHVIENSTIYENVNAGGSKHEAHSIIVETAKNTVIRGNTLYGFVGDGVQLYKPSDIAPVDRGTTRIENNHIYNTRGYCAENAIDIKGELGTVIIRGNKMNGYRVADKNNKTGKNSGGCKYFPTGNPVGQAIIAHTQASGNLTVEQNEFYDMESALTQGDMRTVFRNNIVHDFVVGQPLWGIGSKTYAGVLNLKENITVEHNTFARVPRLSQNYGGFNNGATLTNNIFYDVKVTSGGKYSNNAWFGGSQRQSGSGDVTSGTFGLNLMTFVLESGSALIDKGKNINITADFGGGARPVGSAPDIGADEFGNSSGGSQAVAGSNHRSGSGDLVGL